MRSGSRCGRATTSTRPVSVHDSRRAPDWPKLAAVSAGDVAVGPAIADVNFWWHSLELPGGVVTPGFVSVADLKQQLANLRLPDLAGKSVLDVGAWDGFFSFAAEEAGASRVVALDYFVWSLDFTNSEEYWDYVARTRAAGARPRLWGPACAWWDPERLPGKRAFDAAKAARASRVEPVVADFMTCDLASLGTFDVTLFLGVLYHLTDPLTALRRVRSVTRELAVVETAAVAIEGQDRPLLEFAPGAEIKNDPTNWVVPNEAGAIALVRAAGFEQVTPVARLFHEERSPGVTDFRLVLHARPFSDRPAGGDDWDWRAEADGSLAELPERLAECERELAALRNSRTFRYTAAARSLYGRLRRRGAQNQGSR